MDGLPVNEIGFVFAPSRRRVTAEEAAELIAAVRGITCANGEPPRTVGVFVNADAAQIDAVLSVAPLDVAQLHGDESPDYCLDLKRRHPALDVWRVFSIKAADSPEAAGDSNDLNDESVSKYGKNPGIAFDVSASARLAPYRNIVDACLIDAPGGGTGEPFNWSVISEYKKAAKEAGLPLYVAGGLNEENVEKLLKLHAPDGIDVSSGVESGGVKDIGKIRSFVGKVIQS